MDVCIYLKCSDQSVLSKGRSFTGNSGTKGAVLPKGSSSTANSGTKVAVLLEMNRCGSFLLLSSPHSLFSIWTDHKRSGKIPGAPPWRWAEWIWLTGPSGLYRNSPRNKNLFNISSIRVFDQIKDPKILITLRPLPLISEHKCELRCKIILFNFLTSILYTLPQLCPFFSLFHHLPLVCRRKLVMTI